MPAGENGKILPRGQIGQEIRPFDDGAQLPQRRTVVGMDVVAADFHIADGGPDQPGDQFQQGAFARPVGPQQPQHPARCERQRKVFQNRLPAVPLGQPDTIQNIHGHDSPAAPTVLPADR
ncbi:hypothetical protein SDC9_165351 [bioreactor metagenome]|uniref:Uncharacterized protein n=1 Tax=bioreactor metagenome TaxID=1076179 RepID=A0A645G1C1_9ZZZZ